MDDAAIISLNQTIRLADTESRRVSDSGRSTTKGLNQTIRLADTEISPTVAGRLNRVQA